MNDQIAEYYENDPNAMVWRRENSERREIGLFIGHVIANELSLPERLDDKRTVILSVASNVGVMEQGIQEEAGDSFVVVANDIARLPRLLGVQPLRSDARELPVANESVTCAVDVAGALWHQLAEESLDRRDGVISTRAEKIIAHYVSKLRSGGWLLVDDGYEKSTGQLIDEVFSGSVPVGFAEPVIFGEEPFKLRAYQKI